MIRSKNVSCHPTGLCKSLEPCQPFLKRMEWFNLMIKYSNKLNKVADFALTCFCAQITQSKPTGFIKLQLFIKTLNMCERGTWWEQRAVWTWSLTHSLHLQVNDDKPHPTFRVLPGDSAWTRKIVTHSVLYNLVDFMTDAIRAVNYIKAKKLTRSTKKKETWLLKHKQQAAWSFLIFYLSGHIFIYLSIYLLQ